MSVTRRIGDLADLARATAAAFRADGCRALSAALVYYSALSAVPLVILAIALPGVVFGRLDPAAGERVRAALTALAGPLAAEIAAGPLLSEILARLLERVQRQSIAVSAISFATLLYSAAAGLRFLRYAFSWIWRDELPAAPSRAMRLRKTLGGHARDLLVILGLAIVAPLLASAGLLAYGLANLARTLLVDIPLVGGALATLLLPALLLALYAGIYLLLLLALTPVRLRPREILPPALACAAGVLATTYGLVLYIRLLSASSLYGAIGTIFALQVWAFANAAVLFSCAELGKVLVRRRRPPTPRPARGSGWRRWRRGARRAQSGR